MLPMIMSTVKKARVGNFNGRLSRLVESGKIVKPALLKPDTERKADCHRAVLRGNTFSNCQKIASMPARYMPITTNTIRRNITAMPPNLSLPMVSRISMCSDSDIR